MKPVLSRRQARGLRPEFEERLTEWVGCRTVSAESGNDAQFRALAGSVCRLFAAAGGRAEVQETPGRPVVIGEIGGAAGDPVLTVYNHLDVQPAREPSWRQSDPFEMRIEGKTYRGRGTTDDKGPALTAFLAARHVAQCGLPLRTRFIWEMEEEIGSPHFAGALDARRGTLDTAGIVVSDTVWLARNRPAVSTGLRGAALFTLRLETAREERHSGLTGGVARNPLAEICEVLARCHDARTGRLRVPGFPRAARPRRGELADFRRAGFSVARFRRMHGLRSVRTRQAEDAMKRLFLRPTFEVHAVLGGYDTGEGIKTAVPCWAEARVSMRLVPGQEPDAALDAVRRHVRRLNPDVVFEAHPSLAPFLADRRGWLATAAVDALRRGFGKQPAFVREGGSIGAIPTMAEALGAPVTLLGLSLPEHGYHAPNENFDWDQAEGGLVAFSHLYERAATHLAGGRRQAE